MASAAAPRYSSDEQAASATQKIGNTVAGSLVSFARAVRYIAAALVGIGLFVAFLGLFRSGHDRIVVTIGAGIVCAIAGGALYIAGSFLETQGKTMRAVLETAAGSPSCRMPEEKGGVIRLVSRAGNTNANTMHSAPRGTPLREDPKPFADCDYAGRTPLHLAASLGRNVAEILRTNHAEINARDDGGETPLHLAAAYGHKTVVELLLAKGAEVNAADNDGRTPLRLANFKGYEGVAELLRRHDGRE